MTSKLCLKSVCATIPDLRSSQRDGRETRQGTRNGDILVLAATVYMVIASGDTEYRIVFLGESVY